MTPETAMKAIAGAQASVRMADLVADAARDEALQFEAAGLYLDLRRQKIDLAGWRALLKQAEVLQLREKIASLFKGEIVNVTEGRPALHPACRNPDLLGGSQTGVVLSEAREKTRAFANLVMRDDALDGHPVRRIVNIGIGGSDLGPRFVYDALKAFRRDGVEARFVSNLDPADLDDALDGADAETTLILVVSKSFTTQETLMNGRAARNWIVERLGEAGVAPRFAAATAAPDKARAFGLEDERIFPFPDGVGGRYSLWSAAGLALELSLGPDVYDRLLAGARAVDEHTASAPLERNMPIAKGLVDAFNRAGRGLASRCVAAYSSRLERLASYLQQLEMESLGKSVDADGAPLADNHCGPLVWGGRGSDLQHSVFQWLHQGLDESPVDFVAVSDHCREDERVRALNANLAAQGAALTQGRQGEGELAAHTQIAGGRASTTFVMDTLSPETVGALIAVYEHKVFVEALIYGLNPFDQWGVELGKSLARSILSGDMAGFDGPARDLTRRLGLD